MIPTRPSKRISRSSAFAAWRKLPRLGACAKYSEDWTGDDEPDVLDLLVPAPDPTALIPWPTSPVPWPDADHPCKHFPWGQNDALIISLKSKEDEVSLTVNHYDLWRLACVVQDDPRAWAKTRSAFPLTFRFTSVSELVVHRVVEQGVYQKIRASQSNLSRRFHDVNRIDCVRISENATTFVIQINGLGHFCRPTGTILSGYNNEYHLGVVASRLTIEEGHREGWNRLFGARYDAILNAFESVWPVPGWGASDFEQWLIEEGLAPW